MTAERKGDGSSREHEPRDQDVFSKPESAGPSLKALAKEMGLGVVEITADNPSKIGILATASKFRPRKESASDKRWLTTPELNSDPKLTLIGYRVIRREGNPADFEYSRSCESAGVIATQTCSVTKGNIYSAILLPIVTGRGLPYDATSEFFC